MIALQEKRIKPLSWIKRNGREFAVLLLIMSGLGLIANTIRIVDTSLKEGTTSLAMEYANATNLLIAYSVDQAVSTEGLKDLLEEMVNQQDSRLMYVTIANPSGRTLLRVGNIPKGDVLKLSSSNRMFDGLRMVGAPVELTKNVLMYQNTVHTMRIGVMGPTLSTFDALTQSMLLFTLLALAILSLSSEVHERPARNQLQDTDFSTKPGRPFQPRVVNSDLGRSSESERTLVQVFGDKEDERSDRT